MVPSVREVRAGRGIEPTGEETEDAQRDEQPDNGHPTTKQEPDDAAQRHDEERDRRQTGVGPGVGAQETSGERGTRSDGWLVDELPAADAGGQDDRGRESHDPGTGGRASAPGFLVDEPEAETSGQGGQIGACLRPNMHDERRGERRPEQRSEAPPPGEASQRVERHEEREQEQGLPVRLPRVPHEQGVQRGAEPRRPACDRAAPPPSPRAGTAREAGDSRRRGGPERCSRDRGPERAKGAGGRRAPPRRSTPG